MMDRRRFLQGAAGALAGLSVTRAGRPEARAGSETGPESEPKSGSEADPQRESAATPAPPAALTLFLGGNVMLGRGLDQALPYPGDPDLRESDRDSAREYLRLAQNRHGALRLPLDFAYPWGDALPALEQMSPALRLVNLETVVSDRGEPDLRKAIHYRMNPANLPCLDAAGIDGVSLANDHVLDYGQVGLRDTLAHLGAAGVQTTGAGSLEKSAIAPAVYETPAGRVLIFGAATGFAGVPKPWAATRQSPGVYRVDLRERSVRRLAAWIETHRRPGDRVVLSLHWGADWGYAVDEDQLNFAHRLVDAAGVDVVHGHGSRHPRPIEIYHGRLILHGCGSLLNDYEGIAGEHNAYRGDLTALYFPSLGPDGALQSLDLAPMRIHRFRLQQASEEEAAWLAGALDRESRGLGVQVTPGGNGRIRVRAT